MWIQPAAGDAGGAVGAAYAVLHGALAQPRRADGGRDRMSGALLGPAFSNEQIRAYLDARGYRYAFFPDDAAWAAHVAASIADQKVVGLFQGRMEFGPRALGNRSIVADARSRTMQATLNLRIKQRESFRPFAPSVLEERAHDFFDLDRPSPYMLLVASVSEGRRLAHDVSPVDDLLAWVNRPRSDIPAVTHVDGSARVQTVSAETNPRYHALLRAFEERTGCGLLINTSFNVRGEPIVCTPQDAYRCFRATGMDVLSLGSFVLQAHEQPTRTPDDPSASETLPLD